MDAQLQLNKSSVLKPDKSQRLYIQYLIADKTFQVLFYCKACRIYESTMTSKICYHLIYLRCRHC